MQYSLLSGSGKSVQEDSFPFLLFSIKFTLVGVHLYWKTLVLFCFLTLDFCTGRVWQVHFYRGFAAVHSDFSVRLYFRFCSARYVS